MKFRSYDGSLTCALVASVLVVAIFFAALALALTAAFGADADRPCLSKEQARAKWPKDVLYWHTTNRCWDNVSIRSHRATYQKKNSLQLGKPLLDPSGNLFRHSGRPVEVAKGPSILYPDLMPGPGVDGSMLRPDGMTWWPVLIDVDEQPQFVPWQKRISFLTQQEKP